MKNTISRIFKPVAYTLLVSGVLFSASCSSSSIDEPQTEQATSNKQQTVSIPIQAEVQLDESARSLIYKVGQDGSFKYNLKDGTIKLFTTIRNSQPGKAQYSAMLDWKVDPKSNTLYLNQAVSITTQLGQAMEQGTWYASVAFSATFSERGRYSYSGLINSGPTMTSQRFVYDYSDKPQDGGIYEGLAPKIAHETPSYHNHSVHNEGAYLPDKLLDQMGTSTTEVERQHIPTLYIMPWAKVDITGSKSVDGTNTPRSISYRETTEEGKRIKFSGTLKPIGSVVRIKLEVEPATYQMKDGSQDISDIKEYVEDANWSIAGIDISNQEDNGYYDFSSGTVGLGQLPPRVVSTRTTEKTYLSINTGMPARSFNAPKKELGYFYYWVPDNTSFTIGYQLEHPYIESDAGKTATPYRTVGAYVGAPTTADARYKIENNTFGYYWSTSKTKFPVYASKQNQDPVATAKWNRLYNRNPYNFTCAHVYAPKTITIAAGHTKAITLKIKPEVKEAQRQTLTYTSYGAI